MEEEGKGDRGACSVVIWGFLHFLWHIMDLTNRRMVLSIGLLTPIRYIPQHHIILPRLLPTHGTGRTGKSSLRRPLCPRRPVMVGVTRLAYTLCWLLLARRGNKCHVTSGVTCHKRSGGAGGVRLPAVSEGTLPEGKQVHDPQLGATRA